MQIRNFGAMILAAALAAGCATSDEVGPPPGNGTGSLYAALGFDGPVHDVTHIGFRILPAGVACDDPGVGPLVGPVLQPLEDEFLPAWLEPDPPAGDQHPFADLLSVLQPGDYTVCARAMTTDDAGAAVPSAHCGATSGDATVVAEQTTEIVLFVQCVGDPTGALDVVVALNDPPHIDDLTIEPSKFITICEDATITVFAADPNGDALTYTWLEILPTGEAIPLAGEGNVLVYGSLDVGPHTLLVLVEDGHGGSAELSFPVHVSAADCGGEPACGDGVCDPDAGEACDTCEADCGPCPACGDGVCDPDAGEACDTCEADCGPCPACGDGVCDPDAGETCDTCEADCGACCGNGVLDTGEVCDDGNTEPGDGCDASCMPEGAPTGADWVPFDCPIGGTSVTSACSGPTLARRSAIDPNLWVCAITCTSDRYKLLLADAAVGPYYEIGDLAGHGEDHCELIGGTTATALGDIVFGEAMTDIGYWRHSLGDPFDFGTLPGNAFGTDWYECGISVGFCGDGVVGTGEVCDDGNTEPGDGCDASCMPEGAPTGADWVPFDCPIGGTSVTSACSGPTLARQSAIDPNLWVCAITCTSDRYKLLLADAAVGPYYEIGDLAGHGEDHCELIGGTTATALGDIVFGEAMTDIGYWRHSLGDPFDFGTLPGNAFGTDWYECGISVGFCGDGVVGTGEVCDDGNTEPGDGCDASCMPEGAPTGADWVPFDCPIGGTSVTSACSGPTLARQSAIDPNLWVCAITCTSDRYKLLLADAAVGPYYEIGDLAGHGEDHCELIGGTTATALGDIVFGEAMTDIGYWRHSLGDPFDFGTLPGNAFGTDWYECGISVGFCGDGVVGTGEACDDGNTEPGDGCDASCMPEGAPTGADWVPFDCPIGGTSVTSACSGPTLARQSAIDPNLWVCAITCTSDRYKLLLADAAVGPYYEIGDLAGHGEDHCELIGGTTATALGDIVFGEDMTDIGYWRHSLGDPFDFGTLPSNAFGTDWYECGISVGD